MGDLVGVNVPLVGMRHAYIVMDKVPGIEGLPNIRDHDLSVYLKLQGDSLAIGGYEVDPAFWDPRIQIFGPLRGHFESQNALRAANGRGNRPFLQHGQSCIFPGR